MGEILAAIPILRILDAAKAREFHLDHLRFALENRLRLDEAGRPPDDAG
jgi:hypothetical protein